MSNSLIKCLNVWCRVFCNDMCVSSICYFSTHFRQDTDCAIFGTVIIHKIRVVRERTLFTLKVRSKAKLSRDIHEHFWSVNLDLRVFFFKVRGQSRLALTIHCMQDTDYI